MNPKNRFKDNTLADNSKPHMLSAPRNNPSPSHIGLSAPRNNPSPSHIGPRIVGCPGPAPPIPPRPQSLNYAPNRNVMPVGLNSMMPFSRYGMSPFPAYGGLGYNPNRYGYSGGYPHMLGNELGDAESAFLRMAEESSRPAFQSIESLVTAVGSISMMLESTYHAVYSSYRAVLGVVESFSRLKNHVARVLSTLALIRTFQWLLHKILFLLRLRQTNPSIEAAWSVATAVSANPAYPAGPEHSSWPLILFLSAVFGAPWLIFRIFTRLTHKKPEVKVVVGGAECVSAVAMYEFQASNQSELTIKPGMALTVVPKCHQPKDPSWVLVANPATKRAGIVPANYLRYFRQKYIVPQKSNQGQQFASSVNENTLEEAFERPIPVSETSDSSGESSTTDKSSAE